MISCLGNAAEAGQSTSPLHKPTRLLPTRAAHIGNTRFRKFDKDRHTSRLAPRCALAAEGKAPAASKHNGDASATIGPNYSAVQRNLALELVRVTEAAALEAAQWFGKGDKNAADKAAVDMMRQVLNSIQMDGVVVIGEGEKDEAPMLYCGEKIGNGGLPKVEIAVDPLDGTSLIAQGRNGAIAVIALAEPGSLLDPGPCMYMQKLAVGPEVDPASVGLRLTPTQNIKAVAECLNKAVEEVTVLVLDRPRHSDLIKECRESGARIRLISDGDVSGAIEVAKDGAPVDIMLGIGGSPEGVIAAAALRCMGGYMEGQLWPRSEEERKESLDKEVAVDKILTIDELCKGNKVFFAATGVSDGDLLKGVRYTSRGATTNSLVMRVQSGTVRFIDTFHRWEHPGYTPFHPGSNSELSLYEEAV